MPSAFTGHKFAPSLTAQTTVKTGGFKARIGMQYSIVSISTFLLHMDVTTISEA